MVKREHALPNIMISNIAVVESAVVVVMEMVVLDRG